ncbi:MAG: hypothetical protein AB8G05_17040 [Oligoflexales bacterium]
MTENISKKGSQTSLEDWDKMMVSLGNEMFALAKACAAENVKNVLEISKNFLDQDVHQSIDNFYNLYFKNDKALKQSEDFNSIVDHVVESIQGSMNNSNEPSEETLKKATMVLNVGEKERLALSQAQKQIETLISMQDSIREKVAPILASMQFEDMMRQRVDHLEIGFEKISQLSESCTEEEISKVIADLEKLCASKEETIEFYEEVKKEDPPDNFMNKSNVITF